VFKPYEPAASGQEIKMAFTVDQAFINTHEGNVRNLAQQSRNQFRPFCIERNEQGASHEFFTLAPAEMQEKGGRRQATPENDSLWANRIVTSKTYNVGDTMERDDQMQMVIDPKSAIAFNHSLASRRKWDDIIIDAAEAAALDINGTVTALPAAQILHTGGASEISFDILTEVQEKFGKDDIDQDISKIAAVSPTQIRKLMHDPKATNADYVTFKAIQDGKFADRYMGFYWVVTNRLNSAGAGRVNCIFATVQAMGLKVDYDYTSEIAKDPSKSFMWRIYGEQRGGAVRIEDKHVIIFDAKDTVTL
jgi:hypothetical protein